MADTIKRRAAMIQRKWSDNPRFIFAITGPNGKLAFVAEARDMDTMWADLAHDLRSTPDDMRAEGWRVYPAMIEWEEKECLTVTAWSHMSSTKAAEGLPFQIRARIAMAASVGGCATRRPMRASYRLCP